MASLDREVRVENRKVSRYLLFYPDLKKQYFERREEILGGTKTPDPSAPAPGRSDVRPAADPTAAVALALTSRPVEFDCNGKAVWMTLPEMERWLALCEEVEERIPWKMQVFLRLRRDYRTAQGRHGWAAAVQRRFAKELAQRLKKREQDVWVESLETFSRWWARIVEYAARLASKKGLLS